ncbi:MAG: hypothetical protein D6806_11870 [Deltaproteobacteria bacterium]|nr:MAG: hypothetical protein D6806_11870 [Deltaproteobacteria bacterium]
MKRAIVLVMISSLVSFCASYESKPDGSVSDAGMDGAFQDGDVAVDADGSTGVVECSQAEPDCPQGLECLCCGANGPAPICLCTVACGSDDDCRPEPFGHCNTPSAGQEGVCTPEDFNCCWFCE